MTKHGACRQMAGGPRCEPSSPVIDGLIALSSAMLGRWEQIARDHHVDLEGLDVRRSQEVVERREEDRPPSALGDTQPRPSPSAGKSDEGAGPTPGRRHY